MLLVQRWCVGSVVGGGRQSEQHQQRTLSYRMSPTLSTTSPRLFLCLNAVLISSVVMMEMQCSSDPDTHPTIIHLSTHPCIKLSMHLCIHASIYQTIHASMHPCIYSSMQSCIHASMHSPTVYLDNVFKVREEEVDQLLVDLGIFSHRFHNHLVEEWVGEWMKERMGGCMGG